MTRSLKPAWRGATAIVLSYLMGLSAVAGEAPTTEEIVHGLKPRSRTRGLGGGSLDPTDAALIDAVKRQKRGLSVEQRQKLDEVVAKAALPSIDLEVNFAIDSDNLDPTALETLRKLGTALRSEELAGQTFLVAGHTDARGTPAHNLALSERRSAAVKRYLVDNAHMVSDRLVPVGYGQEHLKNNQNPLADENRRVKIVNLGR